MIMSNSLFEALKAKSKYGRDIKISLKTPFSNDTNHFHFVWEDDEFIYNYRCYDDKFHFFIYDGYIRKIPKFNKHKKENINDK